MPIYLDTRGNSVLSVAICDRCNRKFAYTELMPDPNFPGMRVCKDDLDQFDPWRLPALQTENIALRFPRPDVSIARTDSQLLTQGNLNNYSPGNSIFIDGTPPYAGARGDISIAGTGFNNQGNVPHPTPPNAPVVTNFTPTSGTEAGGTVVTITGTSFTGAGGVLFGNTLAQYTVVNDTTITAVAPQGILGQAVRITVATNSGRGSSAQQFTYTASAPRVYSITPTSGDVAGGTSVVIGGYRFTGATAVTIGGTAVSSFTVLDDSRISATTAAHAAGEANVTVTTPIGTGTGNNLFTYTEAPLEIPTVLSISPSTGDVAGGESVTIVGANFIDVSSVTIGGIEVDTFNVVDSQNIETTTPAHTAGSVNITVTNTAGTGTGTNLFTYQAGPEAIYLTPGTTSWTVPVDWTSENMIELWGGGGGGGNGGSVASLAGSGGGGGGYARIVNTTSLTPGQVVTVAVGAGGAYGPNGITAAQAGGTTIFGSVSATGGSGGTTQYASSGGSVSGGIGIGGDVNYEGGRGGGQIYGVDTAPGGDGEGDAIGGAAGGGMGFSNPNPSISGGDGAAGFGGSGGARGVSDLLPNGFPGQDNPKGGGGGGSLYYTSGTAGAGGYPGGGGAGTFGGVSADGADGVIKITYTSNPNAPYKPFTSNGTYTVPAGINKVVVLTVGHGANGSTNIFSSNEGGGYGGQVLEQVQDVTPGQTLTVDLGSYGVNAVVTNGIWTQSAVAATAANGGGSDHGGGGYGNNGTNPPSSHFGVDGGTGGIGVLSEITGQYYGAGGGGAAGGSGIPGAGGLGGGGTGGGSGLGQPPTAGLPNTGGGGGGGYAYGIPFPSAAGGSGFVAIMPLSAPTISGITPNDGGITGGDTVIITGTNLTKASQVTFAGTPVTFTVLSSTTIEAVTPAHAVGAVNVTVTNPVGTATAIAAFTYYDIAIPFTALLIGGGGAGGVGNGAGGAGGDAGMMQEVSSVLTRKLSTIGIGEGASGTTQVNGFGLSGGSSYIQFTGESIISTGGTGGGPSSGGWGGAGGTGAGGAGGPATNNAGGVGGPGLASSFTGTSVYYAGGGGGGSVSTLVTAAGGIGGGGNGAYYPNVAATNGTNGLGAGGGGGSAQSPIAPSGSGGSGLVVIKYLTADASGYTITGGTKTTNGAYTLHTFTSSGNLTIS